MEFAVAFVYFANVQIDCECMRDKVKCLVWPTNYITRNVDICRRVRLARWAKNWNTDWWKKWVWERKRQKYEKKRLTTISGLNGRRLFSVHLSKLLLFWPCTKRFMCMAERDFHQSIMNLIIGSSHFSPQHQRSELASNNSLVVVWQPIIAKRWQSQLEIMNEWEHKRFNFGECSERERERKKHTHTQSKRAAGKTECPEWNLARAIFGFCYALNNEIVGNARKKLETFRAKNDNAYFLFGA